MPPSKPFESFKWRWLSVQPTEGLLDAPVFLGVLRVLARFENRPPSDPRLPSALEVVQRETGTTVNLARDPERNLLRNSGQYWKGTGLLRPTTGTIELTPLGRKVASGAVTQSELAAIIVQQTTLPNPLTYQPSEIAKWNRAGLEIKPFLLILEILDQLGIRYGNDQAYITPNELIKIVIPLSGIRAMVIPHAQSINQFRRGALDITDWPGCTPADNDRRMAREFLLFLRNYGLCTTWARRGLSRYNEQFRLSELFEAASLAGTSRETIFDFPTDIDSLVSSVRQTELPSIIERQRTISSIISRPGQAQFRREVLSASGRKCLLTQEAIQEVLEAAHIIPVDHGGSDDISNGICLRVDIHRLFDSGNIKIMENGELQFSDSMASSTNYNVLPRVIQMPPYVNLRNFEWRLKYY